jgi:hypothetical protein
MVKYVLDREGKEKGTIINEHSRKCMMEGCRHWKASVKWSNGKITYPCWGGMEMVDEETAKII